MKTLNIIQKIALEVLHLFIDFISFYGKIVLNEFSKFPRSYAALIYLFLSMAFCYYPVFDHWLTGFIMMSLPLAILSGFIASCYLFFKKQKVFATAGIIWVLFTLPVVQRLVGSGKIDAPDAPSLRVLSFNGECFQEPDHNKKIDFASLRSDIACFQEYSHNEEIEKQYQSKTVNLTDFDHDRAIGLALFSQYPIVKEYSKIWDRQGQPNINGYLCADIAYGCDTVRVVNVHLWSMGVRTENAFQAFVNADLKTFTYEIFDTFNRLKKGFEKRKEQIEEVESFVAGSRYPVIICGDFNEIPFGYSYGKLKLNFRNAFEEAGQGLGFTLNRHPYFVRIDQQFFSSDWYIQSYKTMSDITFSDHFPVIGEYTLKKSIDSPKNLLSQQKSRSIFPINL
ncbi:endonuclease/exonuclease/phosphatase [Emticicia sp. CRIBPO]|uniref:endonuclease/exonuclease/phosphatase family protein n=1 Tax=Emticicia sp. CRIBPO TaxID=2683258 RepID=UPI0014121765|nr:endonuclease/exonuclease/phosphatase family protein [Emticicia sp. CRIBPO]NBA85344.1 endonuclease/exonuclease/phosphatase [Emticicia sp. CRIBPO]